MFSYIKGTIEAKTQNYIILETGGIGYKIFMSQTAIENGNNNGNINNAQKM